MVTIGRFQVLSLQKFPLLLSTVGELGHVLAMCLVTLWFPTVKLPFFTPSLKYLLSVPFTVDVVPGRRGLSVALLRL